MTPHVDLVIVFRTKPISLSKQQTKDDALEATAQYTRLLDLLKREHLRVVGRRGEKQGQLLVFVQCPQKLLASLVHRERSVHSRVT